MRITDAALDEFIALYKEVFGEGLSRDEASEVSFRLLTLYELLRTPLPSEQVSTPTPPAAQPYD